MSRWWSRAAIKWYVLLFQHSQNPSKKKKLIFNYLVSLSRFGLVIGLGFGGNTSLNVARGIDIRGSGTGLGIGIGVGSVKSLSPTAAASPGSVMSNE